jgi:uncharacterized membrane protein YheB (UPF0754 family)
MSFLQILVFLPVVGAIIGYVTKWVAIHMLFYPSRWIGIGPLGWQGVVQRRAPKFAAGVADTVSTAGLAVGPLLDRIDPSEVAEHVGSVLDSGAADLVQGVIEQVAPEAWSRAPEPVRAQLVAQVKKDTRRMASALVEELKPVLRETIDLRDLVVAQLSGENADRMAKLFQRVGARELRVVIYYGAVLGFFIGLVEVFGYALLEKWWLLPLIGAFDGLINNWFAIHMIFRPYERTRYFGIFPYQGLFPARQREISREYAQMIATEVITFKDLNAHILARGKDKLALRAMQIVEREVNPLLTTLGMLKGSALSEKDRLDVLARVQTALEGRAPELMASLEQRLSDKLAIADTLAESLGSMSKSEFERVLRGVFEEDEWILVALGGVLGGGIGFLQAAIVLALES